MLTKKHALRRGSEANTVVDITKWKKRIVLVTIFVFLLAGHFILKLLAGPLPETNNNSIMFAEDSTNLTNTNTTLLLPGEAHANTSLITEEGNTPTITSNKHLIIHVGPPKTATSSIQCQLQVNVFLNSSKYMYLGQWERRCPPSMLKKRKRGMSSYHKMRQIVNFELLRKHNGGQSQALVKSLDDLYARNYSAIVSSESFQHYLNRDEDVWKFLGSFTEQIPHKVTFVMTYRRYYDWFFSSHYYFTTKVDSPFDRMMSTGLDMDVELPKSSPIHYFTKFTEYFGKENVVVFNMHGGEKGADMTSRFICDVLPESSKACKETTEDALKNPPPKSNSAKSNDQLFGDQIVNAAYQKGFLNNTDGIKRKFVRDSVIARVRNRLGLTFQDLPLKCLSQTVQDSLLQKSIEYEHVILGKDANEELLTQHFLEYKEKNWITLFCNPDEEAILRDTSWIQFFKKMTQPL